MQTKTNPALAKLRAQKEAQEKAQRRAAAEQRLDQMMAYLEDPTVEDVSINS